ncbi:MAG: hypothetical protein A2756_00520 [Candidatus Ryanbacteria bacterium RIFCSPHIGHO2_01_FULL_48_27]|uniref:tRNA-splicing ligase RtcB n=1 Tax=Candidatus Ryanbacteria bacterium RIFCSPHIGHO2_01_FULL_48_27 TaxID=1802115 RepID=A0A1G2G6J1_9BACT|nr:MAG: hypothetical protein A2756_00520 [Candidatus Ryanbacteria bacterium RIFCSPHIGHO2_01_FULL_48_27]
MIMNTFSCQIITDPEIRGKLDRIQKHVRSIARPVLCLPNIHPKAGLESPPQFVVATKDTIVPQLTAPAMNCGMSVFKTNLTTDDFSPELLKDFAAKLRAEVAPRITRLQTLLQWVGLFHRPMMRYDLTRTELESAFLYGAASAVKKYRLPESNLSSMEYGGCVLSDIEKKGLDLKQLVPRSSYTNGRHELGYNFGGNHFLEIHAVEKILDPTKAQQFGIRENQLLLFYHGGGGHATYHLGRYFARREKNTPMEKFALFWLKLLFHFGSLEGLRNARIRWQAYFSRTPFPEIPYASSEGRRLMQSIKIGLNYGYAFRVALLARLRDALPESAEISFVWDAAHNSIMEEAVNGEQLMVHRQDAVRVFTGKPVMVAGWNTLSYLGAGNEPIDFMHSSATPSAGKTIGAWKKEGKSTEDKSHETLVSRRKEPELRHETHQTSEGLFAVVSEFEKEGIIRPVAYLRPLGGLKGQ